MYNALHIFIPFWYPYAINDFQHRQNQTAVPEAPLILKASDIKRTAKKTFLLLQVRQLSNPK